MTLNGKYLYCSDNASSFSINGKLGHSNLFRSQPEYHALIFQSAKEIKSTVDDMLKQLPSSTTNNKVKEFSIRESKAICLAIRTNEIKEVLGRVNQGKQQICSNLNRVMRETLKERLTDQTNCF